jgi:exopolysaccharide biosynthesis protein
MVRNFLMYLGLLCLIITDGFSMDDSWVFRVGGDQIRMYGISGLKRPDWFVEKYSIQNGTNLSFFTGRGYIPPYKDSIITDYKNPKKWPIFTIRQSDCSPKIYSTEKISSVSLHQIIDSSSFVASGTPILIERGNGVKIQKSFFSRRRCQRTALGITKDGSVIIFVTKHATLRDVRDYLLSIGCVDAINVDGGSSTFLYMNGKKKYSSNQGRSYPNILVWF